MKNTDAAVDMLSKASAKSDITLEEAEAAFKAIKDLAAKSSEAEAMVIGVITSEPAFRLIQRAKGNEKSIDRGALS